MSSDDSDSDICDFTTSVSSKLGKHDKFWKNFELCRQQAQHESDLEESQQAHVQETTVLEKHLEVDSCGKENRSEEDEVDEVTLDHQSLENEQIIRDPTTIAETLERLSKRAKELTEPRGYKRSIPRRRTTRNSNKTSIKQIPEKIVLSSDEEGQNEVEKDLVPEDINPLITVKVLWKSVEVHIFNMKKFESLKVVKDFFIKEKKINPDLMFFTIDDKEIDLENCSAISLRLAEDKLIEGSTLPESYLNKPRHYSTLDEQSELKFKVQLNSKRPKLFTVRCKESDKMDIIFWQIMQNVKVLIENIKLYFDGQLLKPSQYISNLDLEEGDCFDLILHED